MPTPRGGCFAAPGPDCPQAPSAKARAQQQGTIPGVPTSSPPTTPKDTPDAHQPRPTIHPDGTPEWGTLRPGDDLVQVAGNEVTIISDGSAGGTIRLPLDRAQILGTRIDAALRYNAQKQDGPQ